VKQESLLSSDDDQMFATPATRPRARINRSLLDPVGTPLATKSALPTEEIKEEGEDTDTATKSRSSKRRIGHPRKSAAALIASVVEPLADPTSPERDLEIAQETARVKNRAIANATARAISAKKEQKDPSELPVSGVL
jgi:hypothetical protein